MDASESPILQIAKAKSGQQLADVLINLEADFSVKGPSGMSAFGISYNNQNYNFLF